MTVLLLLLMLLFMHLVTLHKSLEKKRLVGAVESFYLLTM